MGPLVSVSVVVIVIGIEKAAASYERRAAS